jgi:hypothetical protein
MKREISPGQIQANRANSKRSTGPRTARGKAVVTRNLPVEGHDYSQRVAHSMKTLGERPQDFEHQRRILAEAMEPRDGWEAAWIHDIAILRWRLEHVQCAEMGALATERRKLDAQRRRAAATPTGSAALELNNLVGLLGFTGITDCTLKFEQVIRYLTELRDLIQAQMFDQDISPYMTMLYGKTPGPQATLLKAQFDTVASYYKAGHLEAAAGGQEALIADLNKEIARQEQLQATYRAEHVDVDPVQQDAVMLLPDREMEGIIRYESHIEDQIERKLRQFYARRRESICHPADANIREGRQLAKLAHSPGIV